MLCINIYNICIMYTLHYNIKRYNRIHFLGMFETFIINDIIMKQKIYINIFLSICFS